MKLSQREFRAMNHPIRRFLQKYVEFPNFKHMGLVAQDQDVLEIGCGSGYGALLLSELNPRSYEGIDLMPEQIELAMKLANHHSLDGYIFRTQDATNLDGISDATKDVIVIFGILHHIPTWRDVIRECHRVLRVGGRLFIEEPDGRGIESWDKVFHWGHSDNALFSLKDLIAFLLHTDFKIVAQRKLLSFGFYVAQKC